MTDTIPRLTFEEGDWIARAGVPGVLEHLGYGPVAAELRQLREVIDEATAVVALEAVDRVCTAILNERVPGLTDEDDAFGWGDAVIGDFAADDLRRMAQAPETDTHAQEMRTFAGLITLHLQAKGALQFLAYADRLTVERPVLAIIKLSGQLGVPTANIVQGSALAQAALSNGPGAGTGGTGIGGAGIGLAPG